MNAHIEDSAISRSKRQNGAASSVLEKDKAGSITNHDMENVPAITLDSEEDKDAAPMSPITSASEDNTPAKTGAARSRRARKSKRKLNQEAHARHRKREARDEWWKANPGMPYWTQPESIRRKALIVKPLPKKHVPKVVIPKK